MVDEYRRRCDAAQQSRFFRRRVNIDGRATQNLSLESSRKSCKGLMMRLRRLGSRIAIAALSIGNTGSIIAMSTSGAGGPPADSKLDAARKIKVLTEVPMSFGSGQEDRSGRLEGFRPGTERRPQDGTKYRRARSGFRTRRSERQAMVAARPDGTQRTAAGVFAQRRLVTLLQKPARRAGTLARGTRKAGVKVASITYDPPTTLKRFADAYQIGYPMLSDKGSVVIRKYGILNANIPKVIRSSGFHFPAII